MPIQDCKAAAISNDKDQTPELKSTNGKATTADQKAIVEAANSVINPELKKEEQPLLPAPALEAIKEMTLIEKIMKVENLSILIEKRAKLVQTRAELERFQTASNDFNCNMRLIPGVKPVVKIFGSSGKIRNSSLFDRK